MSITLTVVGTWTFLRHLNLKKKFSEIPVSILKPLKGADPSLYENLKSFFDLKTNAPFEILFSLENKKDPAYIILKNLLEEHPEAPVRIFFSEYAPLLFSGMNPKLKNLAQSYEEAKYDVILISDSNVRVDPRDVNELLGQLDSDTGIITSLVAGTDFKGIGGYLEAVYLNTFYARFMALSNQYAKPCVVGKSMMFRKSTAARFGGIRVLATFLAEDFMAGESMRRLGLKVKTAITPVAQVIGEQSFMHFWKRHIRWGRIRKAHAPLALYAEPLSNSIFISLVGASVTHHPLKFFLSSLGICFLTDAVQFIKLSQRSWDSLTLFPLFWLMRESLALPLWIQIVCNNHVDWRGNRLKLAQGGLLIDDRK